MNRSCKLFAQNIVHQPLARDPVQSFKSAGDDKDAKVRLAALAGAGVAGMQMGFVTHIEPIRLKRGG